MNRHEKRSRRPAHIASTYPPALADNESEQYHFNTSGYGGLDGSRPYRRRDRDRLQAKLDRRFGPGAFVLREDDRAVEAGLSLSENRAGPHQPDGAIVGACVVVARHLGPPHAVTRTVRIEKRAELTAWSRLEELRQNLPDYVEVLMQPGPTPISVVYQIITAPEVDPQVRASLAAAAAAPTQEQRLAQRLRGFSRASDESRDPDGTRFAEGYDPIREFSIDRETSVLADVADRLEGGALSIWELDQELLASAYYDDYMSVEQARRLSDHGLGSTEGERAAWRYIHMVLERFLLSPPGGDLKASTGGEEPPDPGVAGAGGDGPLPADATWTDYVDAHGGSDTSGWWVTLDWVVDSASQPEVVGPYSSYQEAVAAMQDSLLIDGFAEDTKRREVLDDVSVAAHASTITQVYDRYEARVTLIDPHDPNHFGTHGRATTSTNAGPTRSGLLQSGALRAPSASTGTPPTEGVAETVAPSPSEPRG